MPFAIGCPLTPRLYLLTFSRCSTPKSRAHTHTERHTHRHRPQVILYSVPCIVLHWTDNKNWLIWICITCMQVTTRQPVLSRGVYIIWLNIPTVSRKRVMRWTAFSVEETLQMFSGWLQFVKPNTHRRRNCRVESRRRCERTRRQSSWASCELCSLRRRRRDSTRQLRRRRRCVLVFSVFIVV